MKNQGSNLSTPKYTFKNLKRNGLDNNKNLKFVKYKYMLASFKKQEKVTVHSLSNFIN